MAKYTSTPESALLRQICDYLSIKGLFHFRINNGAIFDAKRGVYRRPNSAGAMKGVADIYVLKNGKSYFLELKSNNGKQSDHQVWFQNGVEHNGGKYLVVRDVEELKLHL